MVGRTEGWGGARGSGICENGCLERVEWNCVICHHVDAHCGHSWIVAKTFVFLVSSRAIFPFHSIFWAQPDQHFIVLVMFLKSDLLWHCGWVLRHAWCALRL